MPEWEKIYTVGPCMIYCIVSITQGTLPLFRSLQRLLQLITLHSWVWMFLRRKRYVDFHCSTYMSSLNSIEIHDKAYLESRKKHEARQNASKSEKSKSREYKCRISNIQVFSTKSYVKLVAISLFYHHYHRQQQIVLSNVGQSIPKPIWDWLQLLHSCQLLTSSFVNELTIFSYHW